MRSNRETNDMPQKTQSTASLQQALGPVIKVVMAGEVLAASPSPRNKNRLRTPWTLIVSGEAGPYTVTVSDDAGIRVAEKLKVGDFVVAEATLVPRGARCEIRSLLIQSSRETRMPVVPVRPGDVDEGDAESHDTEGLPWEDTGS
jgi:hypothetical protein